MARSMTLHQKLLTRIKRFTFFQAVRLLQKKLIDEKTTGPASFDPLDEHIRFHSNTSLNFAVSEIDSLRQDTNAHNIKQRYVFKVNFMSALSPIGILPIHYTEQLGSASRNKHAALLHFINLFQNRSIALFYRAWEKYRFYIRHERQLANEVTPHNVMLQSLMGVNRQVQPKHTYAPATQCYLAYYASRHRSAAGLQQLLSDYFGITVKVLPFQGQWLDRAEQDYSAVSQSERNNRLGVDFVAGTRTWYCQHRFRLLFGPLDVTQSADYFPGKPAFNTLCQLTRQFVGPALQFDIQLIVKADAIPSWRIGQESQRLGWACWLSNQPRIHDSQDIILNPST